MEVLACAVRQEKEVKGIKIGRKKETVFSQRQHDHLYRKS